MQGELLVSSVIESSKLWKSKPTMNKVIQKIIQVQKGGHAIILRQSCNKPYRFIYLCLLMSKKNSYNISSLISKVSILVQSSNEQPLFIQCSKQPIQCLSLRCLYKELLQLNHQFQLVKYKQSYIIKLISQMSNVDQLLVMIIRIIAREYKVANAIDFNHTITLGQVQLLINKFFVDKKAITNNTNKYVIFWNFQEHEVQELKLNGILFQSEQQNYQELSDPYPLKYQSFIMIQKAYSLLGEK